MKPSDIGRYVHHLTMKKVEAGEGEYYRCFRAVLSEDPELMSIYQGCAPATVKRGPAIKATAQAASRESHEAGSEIDKLVKQFMFQTNVTDYSWALKQVLKANPQLTRKYAQS